MINIMFTTRVKRLNVLRRNYTYYVCDMTHVNYMKNLHENVDHTYKHIKNVMNVNKRLKNDINIHKMHHILNMCVTVLGGKESRFNKNMVPISISTGSMMCTVAPAYVMICDKNDLNCNNKLVMIKSLLITEQIKDVINLRNSKIFTNSVNNLFDDLKNEIKLLSEICPSKEHHSSVIVGYDDNNVYFKWSDTKTIEMYVDMDHGISIINIVNVKQISACEGTILFAIMCILYIIGILCIFYYDNRKPTYRREYKLT